IRQGLMRERNGLLLDALHVFVLSGFALGQPLFDLLSRQAQFFVAHGSKPVDIVLLVLIVCVFVPAIAISIELVAALFGRRSRRGMHGLVVTADVAVIALPVLRRMGGVPGTILLTGAAILGVVAAVSYGRFQPVRNVLTILSPTVLLFPGLFLFNTD